MASRTPQQQKQLSSRAYGLMKKANELNRRYGVKVVVFVNDSVVPNEWAYQSDQSWVPDFSNLSVGPGKTHFIPSDFITLSEYHKSGIILSRPDYNSTISPLRFSSSLLPNNVNDMDNTLFRALGYPSIEASQINALESRFRPLPDKNR